MLPLATWAGVTAKTCSCTHPPAGALSAEIRNASAFGVWAYIVSWLNRVKRPQARRQEDTAERRASTRIGALHLIGAARSILGARKPPLVLRLCYGRF